MSEPAPAPDRVADEPASDELPPTLARPESGEVPTPFGCTEPAFGPPAHAESASAREETRAC